MWSVNIGKYIVFRFIVASDYDVMVWYGTVWYGMVWYGMVWPHETARGAISIVILLVTIDVGRC